MKDSPLALGGAPLLCVAAIAAALVGADLSHGTEAHLYAGFAAIAAIGGGLSQWPRGHAEAGAVNDAGVAVPANGGNDPSERSSTSRWNG